MDEKNLITNWIRYGINKETIDYAKKKGEELVAPPNERGGPRQDQQGLTTSQIRIVFGELRRIQLNGYLNERTAFLLLKPKLAYAVKRHGKTGIKLFYEMFTIAYDAVDTNNDSEGEKHFKNLMDLMEAVLAYHKYFGGKE